MKAPLRLVVPVLVLVVVVPTSRGGVEPGDLDEGLRRELQEMLAHDQELSDRASDPESAAAAVEREETGRRFTERMKQIVATHGWPGRALVGLDGAMAAFVLVQHSEDVAFQERCLALMKEAAERGDVPMPHVAYLTDRVLVARGKPQIYGTQFRDVRATVRAGKVPVPHPIEDEASVDERRARIGLPPLAEYREMLVELHRQRAR